MSTLIETDAIVIGGGIVGASAALTLALKGKRVAVLERDFAGRTPAASITAAYVVRAVRCRSCPCRNGRTRYGAICAN